MLRGDAFGAAQYVRELIARSGLAAEVVARRELVKDGWTVEYLTFRPTGPA